MTDEGLETVPILPLGAQGRRSPIEVVWRLAPRILIVACLVVGALSLWAIFNTPGLVPGYDFSIYRDAAARWLQGGSFYYPEQVAGPYVVLDGHVLYPPVVLLLFIPIGVTAWCVAALRPSMWGWVAILVLACRPYDLQILFAGTPTIWIVALLALATRWPWTSAFTLIKPALFPFALVGIRSQAWWLALGVFALACLLFVPMWADWVQVVVNAQGPNSGLLYALKDVPLMLIPVAAWATRTVRPRSGASPAGSSAPSPDTSLMSAGRDDQPDGRWITQSGSGVADPGADGQGRAEDRPAGA